MLNSFQEFSYNVNMMPNTIPSISPNANLEQDWLKGSQ